MMRTTFLVAALAVTTFGDDAPAPSGDPIEVLRTSLEEYGKADGGGGFNTIPIEKAVLDAADAGRFADLAKFAAHERFGGLVVCVLGESGATAVEAQLLDAFVKLPADGRVEAARGLAALKTDRVREALRELAADSDVAAQFGAADRVRAALLRSGDAATVAAVRKALASKDADEVAATLVVVGDSHAADDFLADVARLVPDKRKLATPLESAWPDTKTTTSADGLTTTTERVPVPLTTVGDAAFDAANRLCATGLPEFVAWWAEPEKGMRFARGAEGTKRLQAFVAEDAKAVAAKAMRACTAVAAVTRAVRRATQSEGGTDWRFEAAVFAKTWTVTYVLDAKAGSVTVDAAGKVVLR
jgi:hypothetical protein